MKRGLGKVVIRNLLALSALLALAALSDTHHSMMPALFAAEDLAKGAATVDDAAKVIDLRTWPLPEGAVASDGRHIGLLSYEVKSEMKKAFEFEKQQLIKQGWKELPGASSAEAYSSTTLQKSNFVVSLMCYDPMSPDKKGAVSIAINNLGNVAMSKMPVVKGAKSVYVSEAAASHVTALKPAEAAKTIRQLLLDAGWEAYGSTSNPPDSEVMIFKRNAIRMIAYLGAAPAQDNQTMISYSTSLMAADLPAPPDAEQVDFADVTKSLRFKSPGDFDSVAKFYREKLAKQGWKATAEEVNKQTNQFDKPIASQVFRNAAKDIISLDMKQAEGSIDVKVTHLTAAEFAAAEQRLKAAAEKLVAENKAKEAKKPAKKPADDDDGFPDVESITNKAIADALKDGLGAAKSKGSEKKAGGAKGKDAVSVPIPENSKKVTQTSDNVLQVKLPAGKGQAAAKFILAQMLAADWESDDDDDEIDETSGNVTLTKGNKRIVMSFVDTKLADVNLMLIGFGTKLEAGKGDPNVKVADTEKKPEPEPKPKSTKNPGKKPKTDGDDEPVAEPPRPKKPQRGIAKLSKLPNEGKVIVDNEPVPLTNVIAFEAISQDQWVTIIVATEKPLKQSLLLQQLKKTGKFEDFEIPSPNIRLELDDQDRPNSMSLVAKMTPAGAGSSGLEGEAFVEEGRARGKFKLKEPTDFFGKSITGEISFDVLVLTRNDKPAKQLADAPKLQNSGKLMIGDRAVKLPNVVAYEVKIFDEKRTAVFFTEKPINLDKLKASLKKDGTDNGLFEPTSQVKVEIDNGDKVAMMNLWADNASLNSNSDLIGDVVVEDGRARGTVKLGKPAEFFGKNYSFEITFDVDVIPLPEEQAKE